MDRVPGQPGTQRLGKQSQASGQAGEVGEKSSTSTITVENGYEIAITLLSYFCK